jgi:hypothetical protein
MGEDRTTIQFNELDLVLSLAKTMTSVLVIRLSAPLAA